MVWSENGEIFTNYFPLFIKGFPSKDGDLQRVTCAGPSEQDGSAKLPCRCGPNGRAITLPVQEYNWGDKFKNHHLHSHMHIDHLTNLCDTTAEFARLRGDAAGSINCHWTTGIPDPQKFLHLIFSFDAHSSGEGGLTWRCGAIAARQNGCTCSNHRWCHNQDTHNYGLYRMKQTIDSALQKIQARSESQPAASQQSQSHSGASSEW